MFKKGVVSMSNFINATDLIFEYEVLRKNAAITINDYSQAIRELDLHTNDILHLIEMSEGLESLKVEIFNDLKTTTTKKRLFKDERQRLKAFERIEQVDSNLYVQNQDLAWKQLLAKASILYSKVQHTLHFGGSLNESQALIKIKNELGQAFKKLDEIEKIQKNRTHKKRSKKVTAPAVKQSRKKAVVV